MLSVFLSVVIVLVAVGLIVWAVKTLIPLDPPFANGLQVVCVVFVAIYVLGAVLHLAGAWPGFPVLVHLGK